MSSTLTDAEQDQIISDLLKFDATTGEIAAIIIDHGDLSDARIARLLDIPVGRVRTRRRYIDSARILALDPQRLYRAINAKRLDEQRERDVQMRPLFDSLIDAGIDVAVSRGYFRPETPPDDEEPTATTNRVIGNVLVALINGHDARRPALHRPPLTDIDEEHRDALASAAPLLRTLADLAAEAAAAEQAAGEGVQR